jgi:hypothetical protein
MGDLARVMPIIHPYVGGAAGTSHGADFAIVDQRLIYVTNAKALASMVVDLLADGGDVARDVLAKPQPPMTKEGYLEFQRRVSRPEVYEGGWTHEPRPPRSDAGRPHRAIPNR